MKILAVDTSTMHLSAAISEDFRVMKRRNVNMHRILSNQMVPCLRTMLQQARMTLEDIDAFAVGLGPGSFTGLRVGLSTIKGFAFVSQKPVVGVSSLDVLAMQAISSSVPRICVLTDARRNLVFGCFYAIVKGRLKRDGEYALTSLEHVLSQVKEPTVFLGEMALASRAAIEKKLKAKAVFLKKEKPFPQAKDLIPLALERLAKREKGDNINKLVPLYLYPDDCQVRRS